MVSGKAQVTEHSCNAKYVVVGGGEKNTSFVLKSRGIKVMVLTQLGVCKMCYGRVNDICICVVGSLNFCGW